MAVDTNVWYDNFCVYYSISIIPNFTLMELFQNILVAVAVFLSLRFLYVKFFKKDKPSDKSCGNDGCGC